MAKNRAPTPVYLDPGMHPGLEVKGLMSDDVLKKIVFLKFMTVQYNRKVWRPLVYIKMQINRQYRKYSFKQRLRN